MEAALPLLSLSYELLTLIDELAELAAEQESVKDMVSQVRCKWAPCQSALPVCCCWSAPSAVGRAPAVFYMNNSSMLSSSAAMHWQPHPVQCLPYVHVRRCSFCSHLPTA